MKGPKLGTYMDVINQYLRKFFAADVTVVFDGYDSGPSTKDHEHDRRTKTTAPDIQGNETVYYQYI